MLHISYIFPEFSRFFFKNSNFPNILTVFKFHEFSRFSMFSRFVAALISLKIIKNPGQLKFTDLSHGNLFCQERSGIWRGLTNQIFSHKASFGRFFLTPHSSYPKRPPSKNHFFKRNQTKS